MVICPNGEFRKKHTKNSPRPLKKRGKAVLDTTVFRRISRETGGGPESLLHDIDKCWLSWRRVVIRSFQLRSGLFSFTGKISQGKYINKYGELPPVHPHAKKGLTNLAYLANTFLGLNTESTTLWQNWMLSLNMTRWFQLWWSVMVG